MLARVAASKYPAPPQEETGQELVSSSAISRGPKRARLDAEALHHPSGRPQHGTLESIHKQQGHSEWDQSRRLRPPDQRSLAALFGQCWEREWTAEMGELWCRISCFYEEEEETDCCGLCHYQRTNRGCLSPAELRRHVSMPAAAEVEAGRYG